MIDRTITTLAAISRRIDRWRAWRPSRPAITTRATLTAHHRREWDRISALGVARQRADRLRDSLLTLAMCQGAPWAEHGGALEAAALQLRRLDSILTEAQATTRDAWARMELESVATALADTAALLDDAHAVRLAAEARCPHQDQREHLFHR